MVKQSLTVSDETYRELTRIKGELLAGDGRNISLGDVVQVLVDEYRNRKLSE